MKALIVGLFGVLSISTSAQHWRAIGNGVIGPTDIRTLYGDPVSDKLLAGGSFLWLRNLNDTILGLGMATWDGHRWDSLAHRIQPIAGNNSSLPTHWFLRFEDELYACGAWSFEVQPGSWNESIARLNEQSQTWESLECINPVLNGMSTLVPKEPQGTLYATGYLGSVCGYPESCVFRYDGEAFHVWEPFQQIPEHHGNYVGYVFDFQGMTYMTGIFLDPLGTGSVTFLRFNGTSWEHVPGWNTLSPIKAISIRDDALYVAGAFKYATGGPGNLIARFDGEEWNDMDEGMRYSPALASGVVLDLEWFHGELYASGLFDAVGDIAADGIAKWNGQQWCVLPGSFNGATSDVATIWDMTIWRDSLYICGGIHSIDGVPFGGVAQWIGGDAVQDCSAPVGVQEVVAAPTFSVHPNPTTGQLQLDLQGIRPREVRLTDALGRVVLQQGVSGLPGGAVNLDLGALASGTYQVTVVAADGMRHTRTVVRE